MQACVPRLSAYSDGTDVGKPGPRKLPEGPSTPEHRVFAQRDDQASIEHSLHCPLQLRLLGALELLQGYLRSIESITKHRYSALWKAK